MSKKLNPTDEELKSWLLPKDNSKGIRIKDHHPEAVKKHWRAQSLLNSRKRSKKNSNILKNNKILIEALKYYASKCDNCGHDIHEFACGRIVSVGGWTRGNCGCFNKNPSVALIALSKIK